MDNELKDRLKHLEERIEKLEKKLDFLIEYLRYILEEDEGFDDDEPMSMEPPKVVYM